MDDPPDPARAVHRRQGRDVGDGHRPGRHDQAGVPGRRPAPELLHRPRRDPPLDPDRRGGRRRLRAPVRPDHGRRVTRRLGEPARRDARPRSRSTASSSATAAGRSSTTSRSGSSPARSFALLGPNGAGKTTTVEILEGYRRADEGTVRVLGDDPAAAARDHRARVGLMLQGGGGIDPRMTAREVAPTPRRVPSPRRATGRRAALARRAGRRRPAGRATGGCRAGSGSGWGSRWRSSAGRSWSRSTSRRPGWTSRAGRRRGSCSGHSADDGVDGAADEPRPGRRRAGRPTGSRSSTAAGSSRWGRRRSWRAAPLRGAPVPARDSPRRDGSRRPREPAAGRRRRGGRVPRRRGRRAATRSRARRRRRRLVAALAAWCGERGALVVELRSGGASLEERYLELVGGARRVDGRATPEADVVTAAPAWRATLAMTAMELRLALRRGENARRDDRAAGRRPRLLQRRSSIVPIGTTRPVDFLLPGSIAFAVDRDEPRQPRDHDRLRPLRTAC